MRLVLRFLLRYARPFAPYYALGGVMLVATNYAVVRIPTLIGDALNALEAGGDQGVETARSVASELMIWAVLLIAVRTLSRTLFFNPGRDIQFRLMVDLFGHLLVLRRPFYMQRKVGELVSVAANDTQSVRLLAGFAGLQVLNVAVAIPMHVVQLIRTDPVLTAWCVGPVILGALFMRWTISKFYTLIRRSMEQLAQLSDRVLESYSGVGTIRSHVAREAAVERFDERNREYRDLALAIARIRAFAMPVLAISGLLATTIVLWIGGERVIEGKMAVGHLATFTTLLLSLVGILTGLAWVLTALSRGTVALRRVSEILDVEAPATPEQTPTAAFGAPPRLELRALSFCYPERDEDAVHDVSAVVQPGGTLGIFGKTGAGKSTLIELLSRIHEPAPGSVFVDGKDVTTLELDALRQPTAVVLQTPFLFSTTLRDNIRLRGERTGHLLTDDAQATGVFRRKSLPPGPEKAIDTGADPLLEDVLDAACLRPDLAQLPEGLDTVVGERGVMLSGGQRQRTALARALYRRPSLLLLDDVLSAVDQQTEVKLVSAIRGLRDADEGRPAPTTVVVSHRTSVLEHADEILVLADGRVAERGTHAELVARDGVYAEAHQRQEEEQEE